MKSIKLKLAALSALICFCVHGYAQVTLSGQVSSGSDGDKLPGASVSIKGTVIATTTDSEGKFRLKTSSRLPITIAVSFIGFKSSEVEVTSDDQNIDVQLEIQSSTLSEVVVSASKVEESIMHAPVTVEKLNITELRNTPSFDTYGAIANLKGVQASTGSFTFTTVNTRGFSDMQNWRFVQLIDGMDASSPGLNYPLGGNSGPADIDIESIELVPGANSALYGANAFNGLLTINTKNPFHYQGLSAYAKGGVTVQDGEGSNPIGEFGLRYAKAFNKFAFKVNFATMNATDWNAKDESYYINVTRSADPAPFLSRPRNHPNFDAVNVYGDEISTVVNLGPGTNAPINRTGIKEKDVVDYNVGVLKWDAALHYRITDNILASYSYRFIQSDAILRHTTMYPLVNWHQQFHRFEIKGSNWSLKSFHSAEDAGDSYFMLGTGAFIERGRKSDAAWGADYGAAYRGEVAGVTAASHDEARSYADRDLPSVDSNEFEALRNQSLSNTDVRTGGSKLISQTTLASVDGNYTFSQIAKILDLQAGASYRQFNLDSRGVLFNDGPSGNFDGPIPIQEYGGYLQAGKKLANERLNLRGSLRFDNRPEFQARVTPRVAAVYALDTEKNHNVRVSYQTGFRNPAALEGYLALDIGSAVLLGGIEKNIQNYNYIAADGTPTNGTVIHSNLVTLASFQAFAAGGSTDPSLLVPANLKFLKQEKNTSYDIGYKALIGKKLFVDLNYYYVEYSDLVVRINTFSRNVGRVFAVYTNVSNVITSQGAGLGLEYFLPGGYSISGNYTYTSFDAETALKNNPGFLPSFNTPENRFNLSVTNPAIGKSDFGFNIKYRWWDTYNWQSPFGVGEIKSKGIVDLALSYKIRSIQSMIKAGATNVLRNEYNTVYGGPTIGSIFFVSWTYDQMFRK